jgi:hypothetical protein
MAELVMFEHEAEAKRREVHAEIRRARMRNERSNASNEWPALATVPLD